VSSRDRCRWRADVDGQALPRGLVDHLQKQHPPVGRLVELEAEDPDALGGVANQDHVSQMPGSRRSLVR